MSELLLLAALVFVIVIATLSVKFFVRITDDLKFQNKVENISWVIFGIGFLGMFVIGGYGGFVWLKTGGWPHIPFYSLFVWLNIDLSELATIEWQGVKKILLWILDLPLWLMSVLLCGALAYLLKSMFIVK